MDHSIQEMHLEIRTSAIALQHSVQHLVIYHESCLLRQLPAHQYSQIIRCPRIYTVSQKAFGLHHPTICPSRTPCAGNKGQ